MAQLLITGGCGYVGSTLVPEALRHGHGVRMVDVCWFGNNLSDVKPLELIHGDVREPDEGWFEEIDAVIHLAGFSNDPTANAEPELNWAVNAHGSGILSAAAAMAGVKRFVYASTHSIYGMPDKIATEESMGAARGPYPDSKRDAEEQIAMAMAEPVILRLGTLHGISPRMRYDLMVNTFIKQALTLGAIQLHGGGADYRPILDVRDAASALLWAATAPSELVSGQTFNVARGNRRVTTVAHEVAEAVEATGMAVEFYDAPARLERRSQRVDHAKIREAGWNPHYSLRDALPGLIELTKTLDPTEDRYDNLRWLQREQVRA